MARIETKFSALMRSWNTAKAAFVRTFRSSRVGLSNPYPVVPLGPPLISFLLIVSSIIVLLMFYADEPVSHAAKAIARSNSSLSIFFGWLTELGTSGWILGSSIFVAFVISFSKWTDLSPSKRLERANQHGSLCFIFVTVAVTGTLASLIKNTIGRARPKYLESLGHLHFDFAAFEPSFASFPSGHSTTFGAFCMALALLFPKWRFPLLFAGILGGISRVIVGAHYPSDVLAGLLFGAVLTIFAARFLAQRGVLFHRGHRLLPVRSYFIRSSANK